MAKGIKKQKLTDEEIVRRNLDLQTAFNNYIFKNPGMMDRLPNSFRLVILPQDDPELSLINLQILNSDRRKTNPLCLC